MTTTLLIDVFSDIVCPWCFIGKRRMDAAIAGRSDVQLRWRAYQLQPDLPPEGVLAKPFFEQKFGGPARMKQIFDRVSGVGAEVGIQFDFHGQEYAPNTRLGHEAVKFASTTGHGSAAKEALFTGHFIERAHIGRIDGIVEQFRKHAVPVDLEALREALANGTHRADVDADLALGRSLGVSGVPLFVAHLDRVKEGGAVAISGAQEVATMRAFLAEAEKRAA